MKRLSLAYSTCPNDTFIFYALANKIIDCKDIEFDIKLADVETLNQQAKANIFDISKLSFAAVGHFLDAYQLLNVGTALGRGCGPLVVAKPEFDINTLNSKKVAAPGSLTTAFMLLNLYLSKKPNAIFMPFDQIMPAVQSGEADFGVIIHEGRFTYENYGLVSIVDLGKWWEQKTALPIPLGCIAIRRNISVAIAKKVENIIKKSLTYSLNNRNKAFYYIKQHAQEISSDVINQHINLYVNEFTMEIGREGKQAVNTLFEMAISRNILPENNLPVFVS